MASLTDLVLSPREHRKTARYQMCVISAVADCHEELAGLLSSNCTHATIFYISSSNEGDGI